ncbi:hypothetical protein JCM19237_248 [Photobacterium aphoticum]|uniref:Uncharacterized protein n=1 Tax=Photobacterium aphoticum TaxID=754436 RepID=A0A090R017_9GAMM|nr:hypothetical protein JCM19237_248 [Photobacterium aphoticum]
MRLNRQERQNACFIAAVATFIKTAGSTCFAKPTTILAQYNERSSKFGIKPIQSSTLFTIQKRVIESGALCCELEHDA